MRDSEEKRRSEQSDGVNQGLTVLSYLIGGVLVWSLFGWLADRLLDTEFLLPVGILVGAAGAVYLVIKRFGQMSPPRAGPDR
jgi:F0F1-type ATP synthase assembly protein I